LDPPGACTVNSTAIAALIVATATRKDLVGHAVRAATAEVTATD
jgi:hypothetical protein